MLEIVVKFAVHLSLVAACPSMRGTVVPAPATASVVMLCEPALVVAKRALIPNLHLWSIPVHRDTQGANSRDVKPSDLQALSHD